MNNRTVPPALTRKGASWWLCAAGDVAALSAYLDARPDLRRWQPSATDTRRRREVARWYHKPPGYLGRIPAAGIVLDRVTPAGAWLRIDGSDAQRCAPILDALTTPTAPADGPQVEQLGLFAMAGGVR